LAAILRDIVQQKYFVSTLNSNHTIESLEILREDHFYINEEHHVVPYPTTSLDEIVSHLQMNKNTNKFEAAREKILLAHFSGVSSEQNLLDLNLDIKTFEPMSIDKRKRHD
jgi:hypothetical protein